MKMPRFTETVKARRNYLVGFLFTILLGLLSRLPLMVELLGTWLGDMLYATMIFWLISIVFPQQKSILRACIAFAFCLFIEVLQVSKASFLMELRSYRLGALVLGNSFSWSDLFLYFIGATAGILFDSLLRLFHNPRFS